MGLWLVEQGAEQRGGLLSALLLKKQECYEPPLLCC